MSILLVILGAMSAVAGVAMLGIGIPDKEFSLGSTLIIAGTTAIVGGFTVIGLGLAVAQLRRIADTLASRPGLRLNRPADMPEAAAGGNRPAAAGGRVPFPPRTKPLEPVRETESVAAPPPGDFESPLSSPQSLPPSPPPALPHAAPSVFPPVMRDEPPVPSELDEVHPAPPRFPPPPATNGSALRQAGQEPPMGSWRATPPSPERSTGGGFDAMWTNEPRTRKAAEPPPPLTEPFVARIDVPTPDLKRREPLAPRPDAREDIRKPLAPPSPLSNVLQEPRAAAILKSGVVDGMGYTLYVDGSIEAELPQGTVRFASIAELRTHLERTS